MIITTNLKKLVSRKIILTITMSVAIAIASIVMTTTTTVWQQKPQEATAASMEQMKASREITAPVDKVWKIVSDVDNEPKYWSQVKSIKNINKTDNNFIEREVIVTAGPQDAKTYQFVTVKPEQMVIQTNITQGPVTGSKVLTLSPSSENKTKIDALWNIDLSGIPIFARGFAKDNFMKTTD